MSYTFLSTMMYMPLSGEDLAETSCGVSVLDILGGRLVGYVWREGGLRVKSGDDGRVSEMCVGVCGFGVSGGMRIGSE